LLTVAVTVIVSVLEIVVPLIGVGFKKAREGSGDPLGTGVGVGVAPTTGSGT